MIHLLRSPKQAPISVGVYCALPILFGFSDSMFMALCHNSNVTVHASSSKHAKLVQKGFISYSLFSSPVDIVFRSPHGDGVARHFTEVFENFAKVLFSCSIGNCSYSQNYTVVLRRRTATMLRDRHDNGVSSRSGFTTRPLRESTS